MNINPGPLSKPVCATSGAYCPSKDRCSSTYEGRAVVCKFIRAASGADRAHLHTNTHYQHFLPMWIILPLLFHLFTPPPSVFLNTNPPLLTHHKLIYNNFPVMDTFKQKQTPLDNPLSIPLSIMYHHASMDSMSTSFHFTHARELEQMKLKQESFMLSDTQEFRNRKRNWTTAANSQNAAAGLQLCTYYTTSLLSKHPCTFV